MAQATEQKTQVTCRKCGATYVPNAHRDFYPDGDDPAIGQCENCAIREALAPKPPAPIDPDKVRSICKLGGGDQTCSFLTSGTGFACAKGSELEATIRARREAGTMGAKGDNCQGPPDYRPVA